MNQLEEYRQMAVDLVGNGRLVDADGTRELIPYAYQIDPYNPWFALTERKLNVPFIMKELEWYMNGDVADHSIAAYAGVWKSVLDHDGFAVSNYGYEAFRLRRVLKAVKHLEQEPDSRRAIVYFGDNTNALHSHNDRKDQSCANSIHWMIRDGMLKTVVSQRSQDYIYGVSGDAVFMTLLTNLVAVSLGVPMDPIQVQVASFHHYPKHTDLVGRLTASEFYMIPWKLDLLTPVEARDIMQHGTDGGPFREWIASHADGLQTIEEKRARRTE